MDCPLARLPVRPCAQRSSVKPGKTACDAGVKPTWPRRSGTCWDLARKGPASRVQRGIPHQIGLGLKQSAAYWRATTPRRATGPGFCRNSRTRRGHQGSGPSAIGRPGDGLEVADALAFGVTLGGAVAVAERWPVPAALPVIRGPSRERRPPPGGPIGPCRASRQRSCNGTRVLSVVRAGRGSGQRGRRAASASARRDRTPSRRRSRP